MLFTVVHELTKAAILPVQKWVRRHLPGDPTAVVCGNDRLTFHFSGADEQVWTDGSIVKQLQQDDPADCCAALWFLCRSYDERNETSDTVHARVAAEALLELTEDRAPFYWYDGALYTDMGRRDIPDNIAGLEIIHGKNKTAVCVAPSPWLKDVLLTSLMERTT